RRAPRAAGRLACAARRRRPRRTAAADRAGPGRDGTAPPPTAAPARPPPPASPAPMTPDPTPAEFYDQLAADYHLIFADWEATIAWEAGIITGLLRDLGLTRGAVLDASCGVVTQAIGMAQAGFAVTATDISPASVERCAGQAAARGLAIETAVADLRVLDVAGAGGFAAAVSFDNALAHLLDDAALTAACAALRRALQPGGALLASIRDYDALVQ